jgi:hypothetical protein
MRGGRVCFPQFWRFWGQVSLAALAAGVLVAAQDPATMSISGRIVSAATGKPVPGATASANCERCDYVVGGKADPDGRFQIVVREPSRYRVSASAPGYLTQTYGDEAELGWTPVNIQLDKSVGDIDFSLHRGSTIAGVVTDEFKEPAIGATVTALARQYVDGESRLVGRATARTDDRGQYRVIGLDAGEYVIRVADGLTGLSSTFAPSATSPSAARRITIGLDAEQDNVNIQMKPTPSGAIEGLVAGPGAGSPALVVNLVPDPNPAAVRAMTIGPRATRIDVANIPAGSYLLFVRPMPTVPTARPMPAAFPSWARESVIVAPDATTHIALILRPGSQIAGSVTTPESPRGQMQINPIGDDHPEAAPARGNVEVDGTFVIANVAPGRYRWVANPQLTRAGQWLLSVFIKDADVTDTPLDVADDAPPLTDVRVTLTEPARVAGTVVDATGRPATAGAVVIAADDSRYWSATSRRIRIVRPDTEGGFEFRLPAGRYHVIHADKLAPGQLWNPAFLKTVASGRAVIANAGQITAVQLRLR